MINLLLLESDTVTFTFKGDLYRVTKNAGQVVMAQLSGNTYYRVPLVSEPGIALDDYLRANGIVW